MTTTLYIVYTYPDNQRYEAMFCRSLQEAQEAATDFQDLGLKTEIVERITSVTELPVDRTTT